MKLYFSHTSPYARKVRAVAIEHGLSLDLEEAFPLEDTLYPINPLGRIPALVTDDGTLLVDSPVICEFLDHLGGGGLFPPPGPARWEALRRQALGDGLMDSAVPWRQELMRPEAQRSHGWTQRRRRQIETTLEYLQNLDLGAVDIGSLAVACGVDYLRFRFPEEPWAERFPALFRWFDRFSQRESLATTAPR
ncbi:MAG: glutathione S-transferase N-terminal domain-containing protein [Candidatus Eremiobacterota bacterium]